MSPRTTGRALVILLDGWGFEADITIEDGLLHCSRVARQIGSEYYRAADRVLPASRLKEARWLDAVTA